MLSVDDALARVAARFAPLPAEQVAVSDALGRVLAEDIAATRDQPPAAVSAMDGYAVRSADLASGEARLRVIGRVPAGGAFGGRVDAGTAVRIFTGAPLPDGADAVAIQENATVEGDDVVLAGALKPARNVRAQGLDVRSGDTVLHAGQRLTARDLGLAASLNRVWLKVRRRPRVAILGTGDELVLPGSPPGPSAIIASNNVTLASMVTVWGAQPLDLGIAPDNAEGLAAALAGAVGADLLLTSGGASVGEFDLVRDVMDAPGSDDGLAFWKIAMRPGKPLIFGHVGGVPLLGLPGNPVSSAVCACLFVRAAIAVMLCRPHHPVHTAMRLDTAMAANDARQDYVRAQSRRAADGEVRVAPFERQDSSMFRTFAEADMLIVRPPHAPAASPGDMVPVMVLVADGLSV